MSLVCTASIAATAALPPRAAMQRVRGEAFVALTEHRGRCVLSRLRQSGNAKAILPHAGALPEVVFLNTSGGLTGGDRLAYRLELHENCRAIAMTQTAERAYRTTGGHAEVSVDLQIGAGAWLDWLPQETILFEHSALHRKTRIELGRGAGCLALESVVLGRHAMGETVHSLDFKDHRAIYREGRPLSLEPLALDAASLTSPVTLGEARAFASIVMAGEGVADALGPLRAVLTEEGVRAAASAFDGKLACRLMARDGLPLRRQIVRALTVLRGAPAPRVWQTMERSL